MFLLLRVVITPQNDLEMLHGRKIFWMMQTQHLHGWRRTCLGPAFCFSSFVCKDDG